MTRRPYQDHWKAGGDIVQPHDIPSMTRGRETVSEPSKEAMEWAASERERVNRLLLGATIQLPQTDAEWNATFDELRASGYDAGIAAHRARVRAEIERLIGDDLTTRPFGLRVLARLDAEQKGSEQPVSESDREHHEP